VTTLCISLLALSAYEVTSFKFCIICCTFTSSCGLR